MAVITHPKPERTWIDITAADIAAGLAAPGQLFAAFDSNDQYLYDIIVGRDTDVSAMTIPHSHGGLYGRPATPAQSFNYIINAAPYGGPDVADVRGDWHYDRRASKATASGFLLNGVAGATIWQWLPPKGKETDDDDSPFLDIASSIYGEDCKLTVSLYARLAEAPAAGEQDAGMVSFGLADGDSAFLPGTMATLHWTDFSSTTWKRFHSFVSVPFIETGARFMVKQTEQATIGLYVTAFMCSPGHRLGYWQPARLDKCRSGEEHFKWYGYGLEGVPFAEKATSITNSVRLYPQ